MPAPCRPRSAAAIAGLPPGGLSAGGRRVLRLLLDLAWAGRWRLLAAAVVLLFYAVLLPPARAAHPQAVLPVLANLLACWQFGGTLLPGREPLIARYTRFDMGGLPPECRLYARGLTWIWAVFLGAFAAAHAAALAGAWPSWPVLAAEAAAVPALFLGEHLVRGRRFPHHGRATPWRTLRAVRLAHGARHAG